MSNYVIKKSDPVNGAFIIPPNYIDGTASPWDPTFYTNSFSSLVAISSNSSLILAGRGITDYGELTATSLVYLMEHFAYKSRPLTPTQGQIWYKNMDYADPLFPADPMVRGLYCYDGGSWRLIASVDSSGNLNVGGGRLTNVGNPITSTDGLSLGFGDTRYLQLSGGTIIGPVTIASGALMLNSGVSFTVSNTPTLPLHGANKQYVDSSVATEAGVRFANDNALAASITSLGTTLGTYVVRSGDTMTGTLVLDVNSSLILQTGGTGIIALGSRRATLMADPILNTDGATKSYVDTAITTAIASLPPSGGAADGVVSGGSIDPVTGVITLTRTLGLPNVTLIGAAAPSAHEHTSSQILFDQSPGVGAYGQSTIANTLQSTLGYPVVSLSNAMRAVDQAVTDLRSPVLRHIHTSTGTATITLPPYMEYQVGENRLQVFLNGVKQYVSSPGSYRIEFQDPVLSLNQLVGVTPGTYSFTISVNGVAPVSIPIALTSTTTFYQLFILIDTALTTASVPGELTIDQTPDQIFFIFHSNITGPTSAVAINAATVGSLFNVITYTQSFGAVATSGTLGYAEVGNIGNPSTSFTYTTAPPVGSITEVLLFPG